jgi:glycerol uptake facilitator-like aquaporin
MLLVAIVLGSGVMGVTLSPANFGVALLGNTAATAAGLYVLITILGPVSGAHFNPAVTLAILLRRETTPLAAAAYIAVQIPAALAGAVLAHAMFGLDLLQLATTDRSGAGRLIGEGVATFGLILTIIGALRFRPDGVASAAALWIAAGYWFTSSTSFANPAVTIARAMSDTFAGIRPADAPGFIAAQVAGALLAGVLASRLFCGAERRYRPVDAGSPSAL